MKVKYAKIIQVFSKERWVNIWWAQAFDSGGPDSNSTFFFNLLPGKTA